jgi:hypothetical protein
VTFDARFLEDGLNLLDEINLVLRSGFPVSEHEQTGDDQNHVFHVFYLPQNGLVGNAKNPKPAALLRPSPMWSTPPVHLSMLACSLRET